MRRRALLTCIAVTASSVAGCTFQRSFSDSDSPGNSSNDSPGSSSGEDRVSYESERLVEFGWSESGPLADSLTLNSDSEYRVAVLESPDDSGVDREYLREEDGNNLLAFLDGTDFETYRILAVQVHFTSGAWYIDLDSIRLDVGTEITGTIEIGTAEGGSGADNRYTVFVRAPVDGSDPTRARITFDAEENSTTVTGD